eukprot:scaffold4420_cov107-Cylindrotheca_fusiformis.AAC.8
MELLEKRLVGSWTTVVMILRFGRRKQRPQTSYERNTKRLLPKRADTSSVNDVCNGTTRSSSLVGCCIP